LSVSVVSDPNGVFRTCRICALSGDQSTEAGMLKGCGGQACRNDCWEHCPDALGRGHVVGLKLGNREALVFIGLSEQRPFLSRPESRSLTIQ
jgi:hypothetical protein